MECYSLTLNNPCKVNRTEFALENNAVSKEYFNDSIKKIVFKQERIFKRYKWKSAIRKKR